MLSNLARTDGHPRLSMYGMLIGAGLNTILDPIYIFVLHWGVRGAAIATITSQIISALILTTYFLRPARNKPQHMRIQKKYRKMRWPLVGHMIMPVSYTHLDVYKRQVQVHAAYHDIGHPSGVLSGLLHQIDHAPMGAAGKENTFPFFIDLSLIHIYRYQFDIIIIRLCFPSVKRIFLCSFLTPFVL